MSYMPAYAVIYCRDREIRLSGSRWQTRPDGLGIAAEGVEGWRSTPEAKVTLTERASGNGAHDISQGDILYSARTVTLHWVALAGSRDDVLSALDALLSTAGELIRLRLVDSHDDTYVIGYATVAADPGWHEGRMTGTITVVCPRPERLAWWSADQQLYPMTAGSGGLSYGDADTGLAYPLDYGEAAGGPQSMALLRNRGTAPAYPVVTVTGPMPQGVLLVASDGKAVEWAGNVGYVPLILDSRSCTASMGGTDVSRLLARRGFPVIPPGGTIAIQLMTPGTGWAAVSVRDTYI